MRAQKGYCYFAALSAGLAATGLLFTLRFSLLQLVAVAAGATAMLFLPYEKWRMARIILLCLGGVGCFVGGVAALNECLSLPLWQPVSGFVLFTALCYRFGKKALIKCGLLLGILLGGGLMAGVLLLLPRLHLPSFGGSAFVGNVPLCILVLVGSTLAAWDEKQSAAFRAGGLTAVLLFTLVGALPLFVWSAPAMNVLQQPLVAALRQGEALGLIFCPDVWLLAGCGAAGVWQNALSLQNIKKI